MGTTKMDLEREEENQRLVTEKKIRKKMKDTIFFSFGYTQTLYQ